MSDFATPGRRNGGFPTAHAGFWATPRCVKEWTIEGICHAIRDKPHWWTKVDDKDIVTTWKSEVSAGTAGNLEKEFQYAIDECRWLASQHEGSVSHPAAGRGVFARDDMNRFLRTSLLSDIATLRSRPAIGSTKEDRHPGTPQMVDLVHPSLYCYKRGSSKVLDLTEAATMYDAPSWGSFIGKEGKIEPHSGKTVATWEFISAKGLAWLPAECRVTSATDDKSKLECQFTSYINNLHPKQYPGLYQSLGQLFCHVVPLLEDVLSELGTINNEHELPCRIKDTYPRWEEPRSQEPGENDDDYFEYCEEFRYYRCFIHPDVPVFSPPEYEHEKADISLIDRPLQVIVKIASLELGPGESYGGGVWHIEGTLDERIVATACCYVDCENVQGGELHFRTAIDSPPYEQDDRRGVWNMYHLEDGDLLVQGCGVCSASTGRVLAWPNTLQHRVSGVNLVDESKPGHRTIICFFLVDPTIRIRSTATVPPQQSEWMQQELKSLFHGTFPSVITSKICSYIPMLLSYDDACKRREDLMEERRASAEGNQGDDTEAKFSLCEH